MKKEIWLPAALSAAIMLGIPWAAVTFVPADGGMAVCFVHFFGIAPMYSLFLGVFAGGDLRKRWFQTLLSPALFLAGTRIFFDPGESLFTGYAVAYLLVGLAAMVLSRYLYKIIRQ